MPGHRGSAVRAGSAVEAEAVDPAAVAAAWAALVVGLAVGPKVQAPAVVAAEELGSAVPSSRTGDRSPSSTPHSRPIPPSAVRVERPALFPATRGKAMAAPCSPATPLSARLSLRSPRTR